MCNSVSNFKCPSLFSGNKKIIALLIILGITLLTLLNTGCSKLTERQLEKERENLFIERENVVVFPHHTYTLSVTAVEDIDALNKATNVAVRFCDESNHYARILSRKTQYQGMTGAEKRVATKAGEIFDKQKQIADTLTSDRDYRVTIKFVCTTPPKVSN